MKTFGKSILLFLIISSLAFARQDKPADYSHYLDQFVDTSADPAQDFFRYSVGKWLKDHPIPSNERSWGIANVVREETYQRVLKINESAAADTNSAKGNTSQKIGDFWFAAMDTATIEKLGIQPLKEEFARIDAVRNTQGVLDVTTRLQYIGAGPLFSEAIFQDEMDSTKVALHLYQGGIGLPDRDYYFDQDERTNKIREEYKKHLTKMFQLLGDTEKQAALNSETVFRIETDLANASRKLQDLRDPHANYHKMNVGELSRLTPSINWRDLLEKGHIRDLKTVIVGQPEFFQQVEKSLKKESVDNWKTYLRWNLINTFADKVSSDFDKQNFYFYGTVLNGTPEQRPRWKRMLDYEEFYLGYALGQLYVKRYFTPATKQRYEKLTDEIFAAFRERIKELDWMSEETKQRAMKKLDTVIKKVGYPDKWRDYSNYNVDRTSYATNCLRGNIWLSDFFIAKLYKPVDRTEWNMTPQTYNAYYNPSNNEIVLPAAAFILPGIPDEYVDDAIVYAYAGGSTIGHEITHGFDDQGRQFDSEGNLKEWWTKEDAEKFQQRAKKIIEQFNGYVAVGDLHINGAATEGENIADLGGILLGWDAFQKSEQFKSGKTIGGFTPAQRFFIGWALSWMNDIRPENLAVRVKTDVHSPSFLRVNGPVSNMPEFYKAFNVKPGDKMYRGDDVRVQIW
ncbi:MAG TPA: M13 family metallopeptidase [Pyrinomonadaceae bacterium]|nr:M13 family metallopeptidase [Pyrinomonadaceae bacterium]